MNEATYDYIVVGAGSAGCVIASRLSERADVRVLLIEAGGSTATEAMKTPSGFLQLDPSVFWDSETPMQPGTGTRIAVRTGRTLGGSSSVNGLYHVRGPRSSYDAWAAQGATGWTFDELLPYFRRSETAHDRDPSVRGTDGPVVVGPVSERHPLHGAGIEAAVELGYRRADDISSGLETGFGWSDLNLVGGRRQSAADAYIRPFLHRTNLDVVSDARVVGLRMQGDRCAGVDYAARGEQQFSAAAEVVMTSGAVGSAHLLLLSGIGPAQHLEDNGVRVVADLPGVGSNLQDHPRSAVVYETSNAVAPHPHNPPGEVIGLVRSTTTSTEPDLQLFYAVLPLSMFGLATAASGFTVGFAAMSPHSRGSVRLASASPQTTPVIDPNYLADDRDLDVLRAGLDVARRLGRSAALSSWLKREVLPVDTTHNDSAEEYLRAATVTYYHFVGTCRMGTDASSVVDPRSLRIHGIRGLRVADASIMPSIPAANTNATVYAIAERAAELIVH